MVDTVPVGSFPNGVAVNPDGTRVYVTNNLDSSSSVIDTSNNTVVTTVPIGSFANGVALNPDGTRAYAANYGDNTVSVIDTSNNTVIDTVSLGLDLCGNFIGAVPCGSPTPTPTATATATPTSTPMATALDTDRTPTVTPTATASPTPTQLQRHRLHAPPTRQGLLHGHVQVHTRVNPAPEELEVDEEVLVHAEVDLERQERDDANAHPQ